MSFVRLSRVECHVEAFRLIEYHPVIRIMGRPLGKPIGLVQVEYSEGMGLLGVSTTEFTDGYMIAYKAGEHKVVIGIAGTKELEGDGALFEMAFFGVGNIDLVDATLNEGDIAFRVLSSDSTGQ